MGLQGGTVYDLAFHPTTPATMYAAAPNGFYRSTDSGATWQQACSTPTSYYLRPSALAVTPGNPDHLYVAVRDGKALRSVDRGSTLARAASLNLLSNFGAGVLLHHWMDRPFDDGVKTRVYRSTDQGAMRERRGMLPLPSCRHRGAARRPERSETVYAAAYGGVYRSTDGAASCNHHL